ncbi:MAG: SpoIVB peptidase [Clostridiales bacterium 43-6]|nr:MAG: SpoIVB peptidase [Clostridiales bacterium 43-6]
MNKFFKKVSVVCAFLSVSVLLAGTVISKELPNSFNINNNANISFNDKLPVTGFINQNKMKPINNSYSVDLKLFGVIPIKQAQANISDKMYVVPCGETFGIKIFTEGVMVVGMTDIDSDEGLINPAKKAGLKVGDNIISINGMEVNSNDETAAMIERCQGKQINLIVKRNEVKTKISFQPVKSVTEKKYKAGIWVRDSSAGIGTLTFYNPDNQVFGGLGHPICDVDTGALLPLLSGEIVPAQINSIVKGGYGKTGELKGSFIDGQTMGKLQSNGETGVYGILLSQPREKKLVEIALKQDVKSGNAKIMTSIDNDGPRYFDCVIEKVHFNDNAKSQNMIIRVTDKELLAKTGGIVQGMSGSPILQNGKLVGAVTHVFVGDSRRGYGIFAENMYFTSEQIEKALKNVS